MRPGALGQLRSGRCSTPGRGDQVRRAAVAHRRHPHWWATPDNVPGVEDYGPKTAVKWAQPVQRSRYADGKGRRVGWQGRRNLRKTPRFLPLGRKLVTVATDLELPLGPEQLHAAPTTKRKLAALYERMEFKELVAGRCRIRLPLTDAPADSQDSGRPRLLRSSPARTAAATKAFSNGHSSTPGWQDFGRRSLPSILKPPASTRWRRSWSACHSA